MGADRMSTTISKGKMFRVTTAVDDCAAQGHAQAPELATQALQVGADYWHTGILPLHFRSGAAGTYGYAARSSTYLKDHRKSGKPPLIFSGSLRRDLTSRAAFKIGAANTVELKMQARVLNFAPAMPANSDDLYVRHKNGRGYPNIQREVKAITDDERESVAVVITADLERSFDPAKTKLESIDAANQ